MSQNPRSSTVIENVEHEPFLLTISLAHYGVFKQNELEVRITNDYIEISGEQAWQMASGGADKRSFVRRHVLPNHIDLNSIFCRLIDENKSTILVSARNISFVTKITNGNRPTVDYTLAFNEKGIQYLKRYNLKSSSSSLNQAIMSKDKFTSRSSSKMNSPEAVACTSAKSNADALFGLIKKASPSSRLFTNEQGQKNIDLANELKNKEKAKFKKIHLTVDQLMAQPTQPASEETPKKKKKSRKSKSKKNKNKANESKESIQSTNSDGDKKEDMVKKDAANEDAKTDESKKDDVNENAIKKDESKKGDAKQDESKKDGKRREKKKGSESAKKDKSKLKDKNLKKEDDKSKDADEKKDESTSNALKTTKAVIDQLTKMEGSSLEEAKKLDGASSDSSLDTFVTMPSDIGFEIQASKNDNQKVSKDSTTLRSLFNMLSGGFTGASSSSENKPEEDKLKSKKDSSEKSDDNNNNDKSKKEKRVVIVG